MFPEALFFPRDSWEEIIIILHQAIWLLHQQSLQKDDLN